MEFLWSARAAGGAPLTPGEYVAAAYGVVFVFVLVYVAIVAAKLARLQRETTELLELVRARDLANRVPDYAAAVRGASEGRTGAE